MKLVYTLVFCAFSITSMASEPSLLLKNKKAAQSLVVRPDMSLLDDEFKPHFDFKVNVAALLFSNISSQAEYAFHKNLSVALGVSYMIPKGLPSAIKSAIPNTNQDLTDAISSTKLSGYALTPEFRFYPGPKKLHQAPYGFYLAPYMRINNYSINSKTTMHDTDEVTNIVKNYDADISLGFRGIGGGLMIGSQWVIGKHFTIDWWILGLQYMSTKFTGSVSNSSLSGITQSNLDEVENQLKDLPLFGTPTVSSSGNKVSVAFPSTGIPGVRGGLAFGFVF